MNLATATEEAIVHEIIHLASRTGQPGYAAMGTPMDALANIDRLARELLSRLPEPPRARTDSPIGGPPVEYPWERRYKAGTEAEPCLPLVEAEPCLPLVEDVKCLLCGETGSHHLSAWFGAGLGYGEK